MVTAERCSTHSKECLTIGITPEISVRRATILTAISRTWATLAIQTAQYESIFKEKHKGRRVKPAPRGALPTDQLCGIFAAPTAAGPRALGPAHPYYGGAPFSRHALASTLM
jgi:hypothetical protein